MNAEDERGRTALSVCSRGGLFDAVTLLLAHHANANLATFGQERTPLHYAAANGHVDIVNALLEADAKVNARDDGLSTPLHEAAKSGSVGCVLALIQHNAQLDAGDCHGKSPADYAANQDVKFLVEGRHTSHSHPLHLALAKSDKLGKAKVALSMCPGRIQKNWRRRLDLDLAVILRRKVQCVIVLLTDEELALMGLAKYIDILHEHDLEAVHYPIPDKWVPSSVAELSALVEILVQRVRRGLFTLVHCDGGKGRSGLVVAALLGTGSSL